MQFAKIGEIMGITEITEIAKRAKPRQSWEARNYARKGDDPAETNPRRQGYMPPLEAPYKPPGRLLFCDIGALWGFLPCSLSGLKLRAGELTSPFSSELRYARILGITEPMK